MDINTEKTKEEATLEEQSTEKATEDSTVTQGNSSLANDTDKQEEKTEEKKEEKKEKKSKKSDKSAEELKKLQKDYENLNDRYMRTLAEYDNFRKRTQKDLDARVSNTKVDLMKKILPVVDNFERAASNSNEDFETYKKGIEMTVNQFLEIISALGVESFGEKGETFDPNIHNGVMHVEDENAGENEIVDVFMKGYKLGDKIIRPATVKVAN